MMMMMMQILHQFTMNCNKRYFAFDVRDVHVLKFGCTVSNFWAY